MQVNKDISDDPLGSYRSKRRRTHTPEPFGDGPRTGRAGIFVVQKHAARATHFDLRLELDGRLLSWAVPKGPSLDPKEKRLAIRTEDHPLEYSDFEGVIPPGNYGAGAMIVWDRGRWTALEEPRGGLETGKLLFTLHGYKLQGLWTLVLTHKSETEWLLIKKPDEYARSQEDFTPGEESILSGLTVEQLAEGGLKAAEIKREVERTPGIRRAEGRPLVPMLAETTDRPFSREGWIFEVKYDGFRLLARRDEARVSLSFRSGKDATRLFPEITRSVRALPYARIALDGEVVVLDEGGRPSFQSLQQRAQKRSSHDLQIASLEMPATYFVFDLLELEGFDLRPLPLLERKRYLEQILPVRGPVRYAEHFETRGEALFEQIEKLGLEGMMAKKADSPYRQARSRDWLKIHSHSVGCFVVVGFTEPKGSRGGFGALHLAAFQGDRLLYSGRVGTGFSDEQLREIHGRLEPIRREAPPLQGAPSEAVHHWVEPELVCEVRYKELTEQGLLRQPSFLRLREDVAPQDCILAGVEAETGQEPLTADIEKKEVKLTNLEKVLWPNSGHTKGDLIEYYRIISPWLLPYLEDRFVVLDRYPDGIAGKSFFQKNPPDYLPDWIRTEEIWEEGALEPDRFFVCSDRQALTYIANLAAVPLHVWASRVEKLSSPDWCILDLDPSGAGFEVVVQLALEIRRLCDGAGLESFVKTSGGKGMHVLIPLGARYSFEQAKLLAELLARVLVERRPDQATVERRLEKRSSKVYIDYLQNGRGKLLVAPYSLRPFPGAPVSTPLHWEEVREGLDPGAFHIGTVPDRLEKLRGDPLAPVLRKSADLRGALVYLEKAIRERA